MRMHGDSHVKPSMHSRQEGSCNEANLRMLYNCFGDSVKRYTIARQEVNPLLHELNAVGQHAGLPANDKDLWSACAL